MGIDFAALQHGPASFRDGLEFFEDLAYWSDKYGYQYMVPNTYNHQLAEETTRMLLVNVPGSLKPLGKIIVTALMDDTLRKAMLYEKPHANYLKVIKFAFGVRKVVLQYIMPPRPYALRYSPVSETSDPSTGRYHVTGYDNEPW